MKLNKSSENRSREKSRPVKTVNTDRIPDIIPGHHNTNHTADLTGLEDQLRQLRGRLIQAERHERQRIAQRLHDEMQQLLVGGLFVLEKARKTTSETERQQSFESIKMTLQQAIEITHNLSHELYPRMLHEGDFPGAMRWLTEDFAERYAVNVSLELDIKAEFTSDCISEILYHSSRELLFNIVKHARTDHARLHLWQENTWIFLELSDNGKGFDTGNLSPAASNSRFGLCNIRDQVEGLGGTMMFTSKPGQGTHVILKIPCSA